MHYLLELEQRGTEYIPTVNAWSQKDGVAVSKENIIAMLLKENQCRPSLVKLNGVNLKYRKTVTHLKVRIAEPSICGCAQT